MNTPFPFETKYACDEFPLEQNACDELKLII